MTKPFILRTFPREKFPITFSLYSRRGGLLWRQTIEAPETFGALEVPGFGGTEHAPVTCVIKYGDGTQEAY